jgi:hypothetical protein
MGSQPPNSPGLYVYFFPILFCAFWVLICFIVGLVSGWTVLSKRFRCPKGAFHGETWWFQSARMRFRARYGNCLTIGADESGLYMSVLSIFRSGHAPLLIPWAEIAVVPGETGLIFKQRTFHLGRQESIPLCISVSLAAKLQQTAGSGWSATSVA